MSAFHCSETLFVSLATFAASRDAHGPMVSGGELLRKHPGIIRRLTVPFDSLSACELATFYARILDEENARSVNYRYAHNSDAQTEATDITITPREMMAPQPSAVVLLKQCDCLEYQSCETDDWEKSAAFTLLDCIRRALIRRLPGYEKAPWGI